MIFGSLGCFYIQDTGASLTSAKSNSCTKMLRLTAALDSVRACLSCVRSVQSVVLEYRSFSVRAKSVLQPNAVGPSFFDKRGVVCFFPQSSFACNGSIKFIGFIFSV